MMMGSSNSGTGSGPRYIDPNHIFELVARRKPRELLDYLDLIPGGSKDLNYHRIKLLGRALLTHVSKPRLPSPEEDAWIMCWAQLALFHAVNSRFCAPLNDGNPSNITSDAGHYTHPHNSSSFSGSMLTQEPDSIEIRHAAVHNQLSASNSRIHAATFLPPRANSTDAISFPTRRARMFDETSAFNSGTHASAYDPLRGNSTLGDSLFFGLLSTTTMSSELECTYANRNSNHYMHPCSSSSYSRRMLNRETDSNELIDSAASSSRSSAATLLPLHENFGDVHRHAAVRNQSSVSSSRIHSAMLPPLQANTMINFPTRHAGMHDETYASNSGTHASAYVPLRDNSMLAQEFAQLSLGRPGSEQFTPQMLMRNTEAQEFAELSLGRPGSEQFTPQMVMRNTEDVKGKRPASEVKQIKANILRLNVASGITTVGLKSAAGFLIRDRSTAQFMTASCFRTRFYMDPALLFAAACCEGIRSAVLLYAPTAIVLESHQIPLLEHLVATQSEADEVIQLQQFLRSNRLDFRIQTIPEESNGAACELVCHALQMDESKMFCKDPPYWLVPYLDQ